jgi:uridine kinase
LDRAIARAQEGLPPAETIRAYQSIYFPAQKMHFERDHPQAAATMIVGNDPKLR